MCVESRRKSSRGSIAAALAEMLKSQVLGAASVASWRGLPGAAAKLLDFLWRIGAVRYSLMRVQPAMARVLVKRGLSRRGAWHLGGGYRRPTRSFSNFQEMPV